MSQVFPLDDCHGLSNSDYTIKGRSNVPLSYRSSPNGASKTGSLYFAGGRTKIAREAILPNGNGALDPVFSFTVLIHAYIDGDGDGMIWGYNEGPGLVGVQLHQKGDDIELRIPTRDAKRTTERQTLFTWLFSPLKLNQWHYIVTTYDYKTGFASVYVNNHRWLNENVGKYSPHTKGNMKLATGAFKGSLNCLRLEAKVLTAQEVKAQEDCPAGWFTFTSSFLFHMEDWKE